MMLFIDDAAEDEPVIIMSRTLEAPREQVWEAFTRPEHVARWYGGQGFENPVCEMDVRPGGHWRHVMRAPDGAEYPLHFVFVEVVKPEKLVWQDIDYGERPPGGLPTCRNTVTMEDLGARTKWRLVARFGSFAERDTAREMGFAGRVGEGVDRFEEVARSL
jgi:uncharacterized protein YndB with AHSA1/START domain